MSNEEFFADNQANWDDRALIHYQSDFYGVDAFVADPSALSEVVAIDRERLGNLEQLTAVHLQCHIGLDTLSLARLGAQVVGIDLSQRSVDIATQIAQRCGIDATFVQGNVYDAVKILQGGQFDLVYTGVGALYWLPDLNEWANTVADLLRPGGRFFIREDHPLSMMCAYDNSEGVRIDDDYFNTGVMTQDEGQTYTDGGTIEHRRYHGWHHDLGEIFTALLKAGLVIDDFVEVEQIPWRRFQQMVPDSHPGFYRLGERYPKIPLGYVLQAHRV